MRIPLDRDSVEPLYRQILRFLREQICSGALPPAARLPATRTLAAELHVSRTTVTNAYAELESEGRIYSRLGSGTFVAPPLQVDFERPHTEDSPAFDDWPLWQRPALVQPWVTDQHKLAQLMASAELPGVISFAGGIGDVTLFPEADFRKALREVLRRDGVAALAYGDPAGYLPLRTTLAHILAGQGIPAHPDQVLITSGSQQVLSLVAHLLLRPGDAVLLECPTYSGAIDLFHSLGVRTLGIPMDAQGMQMSQCETTLRTHHPRLIYTMPTFQNPTGICMSTSRRRQLIALAERYNVPILEDDFVGDLRYSGRAQPALKGLDPGGRVIYTGTFSKMLMPGIRVGFLVAAGPVFEWLSAAKRVTDLASSNLMQRALDAYISVGRYQAHLRRARRLYCRRRDAMLAALARYLPASVRWQKPLGGLFVWLQLPDGATAEALHALAVEEGVSFVPGAFFFPDAGPQSYLRLNCVMHDEEVIDTGIRRLGRAVAQLLAYKII